MAGSMANDIYSALLEGMTQRPPVVNVINGTLWTAVETENGLGMCMTVPGCNSAAFAEINAYYNAVNRFPEPFDNYCTRGLDFCGKTVGVVGHMNGVIRQFGNVARRLYVFDMEPKDDDDLPAELEEQLLPECDIAVVTGSSIVNGSLPHVLELCRRATVILVGPSVPQCPALLDFGIHRLSGLCITDIGGARRHIREGVHGSPYGYGSSFMIM